MNTRTLAVLIFLVLTCQPLFAEENDHGVTAADSRNNAASALKDSVDPYLVIVGGLGYETIQQSEGLNQENRVTTLALSRFGFRGELDGGIYVESEFEANAGPHGTSVWEGQAALQVRNQLIRISRDRYTLEAGRITDPASLNYFSSNVADQLLMDGYTRSALLSAGFNRGNGLMARVALPSGLDAGLSFNAANPTSMTGSVMIGGTFTPFSRFYLAPYSQVGRDASSMPSDTYHIYIVTPSITRSGKRLNFKAAGQFFQANTDTNNVDDSNLTGQNLRASVSLDLLKGAIKPFGNVSFIQNDVIDPTDGNQLSDERYESFTAGGGLDLTRPNSPYSVGFQYDRIQEQQGEGTTRIQSFTNLGFTYFLTQNTSVGARLSRYNLSEDSETFEGPVGNTTGFLTLRTIL